MSYIIKKKLLNWIPEEKLNVTELCSNIYAGELLLKIYKQNSQYMDWIELCHNKGATLILMEEYHRDRNSINLHWNTLSSNTGAFPILLEEYKRDPINNNLDWIGINYNSSNIPILIEEYRRDPNSENIRWQDVINFPEFIPILIEEYNREDKNKKLNLLILSSCIFPEIINLLETLNLLASF